MKEIELSQIATGIPKIDFHMSVREAIKSFEEYGIYDFLVVTKENKPVGTVRKLDLIKAQNKPSLTVGDLAATHLKLRTAKVRSEELSYLLDFFNSSKAPIFLVDKKGHYMGILFHEVVLYHMSLFKETSIPIFQKIRSLFGQEHYFYCFHIKGFREFVEEFGSSAGESLERILYESVKGFITGDVSLSFEESEVYALARLRVEEEKIRSLYEEFHREFSLLYSDASPLYLYGYCIPTKDISSFEDFFRLIGELKKRLEDTRDASFFIYHGIKPTVVLCEYQKREYIQHIRSRIKQDFEKVVEKIRRTERDLWEFTLYDLFKSHSYFELFYIIGESGLQVSNNIVNPRINYPIKTGKKGADRSDKNYFKRASLDDVYISNIYISQATDDFCITVSKKFNYGDKHYILAGDINYREIHRLVRDYADLG